MRRVVRSSIFVLIVLGVIAAVVVAVAIVGAGAVQERRIARFRHEMTRGEPVVPTNGDQEVPTGRLSSQKVCSLACTDNFLYNSAAA